MLSHEGRLLQGRVSYKAQPFRAKLYDFLSYLMRDCPKRAWWVVIRYSSTYEKA
jgi:hypothetical protein